VAVTTDATLCPACSGTIRVGNLTNLVDVSPMCFEPVTPGSKNRLNLRNELDSLGIRDSPERTAHHLPYPLKRTRPTTLVVAVTTRVVDTCSTSPGFPRPTIDWEEQVWGAVHYGRATFLENSRGKDAFRLPKQIYSA
jgi:hypothetical protein